MRWIRRVSVVAAGGLLVGCLAQVPALAAPGSPANPAAAAGPASAARPAGSGRQSASPGGAAAAPGPVRLADPARVLPAGWRHSADVAVTVSGDAAGLHVLAASEASGYAWRSVATLGDPAVQTDLWIGQACVTASGADAVVVYAPEQAANMAEQQGVLGRAAIVNLRTGAVRELGGGFSIAYFDPGCGTGSTAVLTRGGWANDDSDAAMSTSLVVADAATGRVSAPVRVAGQVTSAVPYQGQIAAAGGRGLEQVSMSGKTRLLAAAAAVPYELTPGADGSLGYQTVSGRQVDLWQLSGGHAKRVAAAAAGSVELRQIGGRVWLVGPDASKVAGLPAAWDRVDAPVTSQMSSTGMLAVTSAEPVTPAKGRGVNPFAAEPVGIHAQLLGGSRGGESFEVPSTTTRAAGKGTAATATARAAGVQATTMAYVQPASRAALADTPGSPSTPVSDDRTCAIPINDPTIQAYQPNFQQVEWAADQAVQNNLNDTRPAGVYGSTLPSYTPQGLFPLPDSGGLDGGGSIPAQVLLGVMTQESNLQQASTHVIQGQTSNPLTSFNWYGNWINGETTDTGLINWSNSDCGYGIGQITTGMCLTQGQNGADQCANQPPMSSEQQLAVAVDYQANIAAEAQMLATDWNTLWELGIQPTGPGVAPGDAYSGYIGEWYMAIWAYNSGVEPTSPKYGNTTGCTPGPSCTDNGGSGGNWGLGYADNPINPAYPPDRPVFPSSSGNSTPTGTTYSPSWDMSHPQYWPYQEKVIAWAFDSITLWDYSQGKDVQAFAYAHGNTEVPPYDTFCSTAAATNNNCDASGVNYGSATAPDSCQLANDHCWWHFPASWTTTVATGSCQTCGEGVITYPPGSSEPAAEPIAAQFAQTCNSTLASNAVIVWEGGQSALGCPGQNWTSQGSFTWNFAPDANGYYSSKIGFDQIGAGFGGHFWFGYAQPFTTPTDTVITGTWNPPSSVSGWTDIKVAIPSYGANAGGASYQVNPGGGQPVRDVQIDQGTNSGANTWADLGYYDLGSGASVSLSNVTPNIITINGSGTGSDIAWSAAAFIPTSAPPWVYTSMGDSYSSGEGNSPYDQPDNGCDRSPQAYGRVFAANTSSITEAGIQHIACSGATIANLLTAGLKGEQPQVGQIFSGSKLVTVTIGGNDIGFANVLTDCLLYPPDCEEEYNQDNSANLYTVIDNLEPYLVDAYEAIQAAAPDAKVVAITYPLLFQPGAPCLGMPVPDVNFLNNVGEYLDNAIISAAQAAGINVMDERYAFLDHQLCGPAYDTPWIYSPPSPFPAGDVVLDTSAWFHPNVAGQNQIADDLGQYYAALQAGGAPSIWPVSVDQPDPSTGWLSPNLPYGIPTTAQAETMWADLPQVDGYATGYNASAFTWPTTRSGCTTRNRVLINQALTPAQNPSVPLGVGSNCYVYQGTWYTPYEATQTQYVETTQAGIAANLPIDHVVAKSNAWGSGANNWPGQYTTSITMNGTATTMGQQMLTDFANDMGGPELLVVSNTSNIQKSDSGPQDWMPANQGMWCAFAKMWIGVKWEWNLALNEAATTPNNTNPNGESEYEFLGDILNDDC